jgi:polysaccharide export outer membrane protein
MAANLPWSTVIRRRLSATVAGVGIPVLALFAIPSVHAQSAEYVVGANDTLMVSVWEQNELSGKFTVGSDGAIAFPLIQRIVVGNLTVREIEALLAAKLIEGGFLKKPQVTVTIETYRSRQIFVIGEVRQPGTFYLTGQETLVQVLARAGSTTPNASRELLVVRSARGQQGPVQPDDAGAKDVVRVDLQKLETGTLDAELFLQDGDTVIVPKAEVVYVTGQVRNPGAYPITRALTVRQALTFAGGVSERGAAGRIKIVRQVSGKELKLDAELDDPVQPNDTVEVPERFF